jgi:2-enoate reductase
MKLFEPGKIGNLTIKNRIAMAPMLNLLPEPVEDGRASKREIDFFAERAKGGTGQIITTVMRPNHKFEDSIGENVVNSRTCIRWLNDLAEACHDYGAKVCIQLGPGISRQQPPFPGARMVAPSPLPNFWDPGYTCRELTIEEIEEMVRDFEYSCSIIAASDIDAIEIHAHQGYLIDLFVTSLFNKRTDKYGGSLENRLRFPMELIAVARKGAGEGFPITYRYGLTQYLEGGRTIEEGLEIAKLVEAAGVDGLHIDCGCYETNNWAQPPTTQPPGLNLYLAEMVKKVVKVPVLTVGKLQYPDLAEEALQKGMCDFISLGRPLLADPEWANKVREGRPEDIVPCLGCHDGCLRRVLSGKTISCAVNPACGREKDLTITPTEKKKKVVVVGGGPGGMEAARIAKLRGHDVTLIEKDSVLGGNLILAAIPKFKLDYKLFLEYLVTKIRKIGVMVKLGDQATPDKIKEMNPDVVVIATGASLITPDYPGIQDGLKTDRVITAVDALLGKKKLGNTIVIVGGGSVGCEIALWLARQGKNVIVIARHEAMRDLYWINAKDIREKLGETGTAKILTFTSITEINKDGVVVIDEQGNKNTLTADTVVLAVGFKPNTKLIEELSSEMPFEVHAIGDCVEPRRVFDTMKEAFRIGRII